MTTDEAIAQAKGPTEQLIVKQLLKYGPFLTNRKCVAAADQLLRMNLFGRPIKMETDASKHIEELEGKLAIAEAEVKQLEELNEASRRRLDEVSSQNSNMRSGLERRTALIREIMYYCGGLCDVMFHKAEYSSLKLAMKSDVEAVAPTPNTDTTLALVIKDHEQPPFSLGDGAMTKGE